MGGLIWLIIVNDGSTIWFAGDWQSDDYSTTRIKVIAGHLRLLKSIQLKSIQPPGAMASHGNISPVLCHGHFPMGRSQQHPPGPHQVMWFVSHFWGTSFRHFVQSVRKHAESVAPYSSLGRRRRTGMPHEGCLGDAPRVPGADRNVTAQHLATPTLRHQLVNCQQVTTPNCQMIQLYSIVKLDGS